MTQGIKDKVVLITGASSGLGEAAHVAERMHKASSIAIPADSFANMVVFAMSQREDADVNKILFKTDQTGVLILQQNIG
jgi:NADP-dependent 3-hydroxy acid dehydrogenase YdfG